MCYTMGSKSVLFTVIPRGGIVLHHFQQKANLPQLSVRGVFALGPCVCRRDTIKEGRKGVRQGFPGRLGTVVAAFNLTTFGRENYVPGK